MGPRTVSAYSQSIADSVIIAQFLSRKAGSAPTGTTAWDICTSGSQFASAARATRGGIVSS